MTFISMDDITSAQQVIAGIADQTPLVPSPFMTEHCGGEFLLKLENMQPIGAFKIRGAMTAIAALAGFLPLVVANGAGAQSQQALGTVIFGGLVVATVLSLGVVPPFYVVIKGLETRWFGPNQQDEGDDAAITGAS